MSNNPDKLTRRLLLMWFLFLALLVGVVIYFSRKFEQEHAKDLVQSQQINDNAAQIKSLETLVRTLNEQSKVPGPQGEKGEDGRQGANGKDSVSTTTVKEVPVKGDKGDSLKFEDLTEEQKAELRGEPALQIELCKMRGTLEIGWRYAGTSICLPVEVVGL